MAVKIGTTRAPSTCRRCVRPHRCCAHTRHRHCHPGGPHQVDERHALSTEGTCFRVRASWKNPGERKGPLERASNRIRLQGWRRRRGGWRVRMSVLYAINMYMYDEHIDFPPGLAAHKVQYITHSPTSLQMQCNTPAHIQSTTQLSMDSGRCSMPRFFRNRR